MKPQDIVTLIKLNFWPNGKWTLRDLSSACSISKSEVYNSLVRMSRAKLFDNADKKVLLQNFEEFLFYGIAYIFPPEFGKKTTGLATAYSAPPLKNMIIAQDNDVLVWKFRNGKTKGRALLPIHPAVPEIAQTDYIFYELFCLIDALRVGRAREKEIARQEIHKRLFGTNERCPHRIKQNSVGGKVLNKVG